MEDKTKDFTEEVKELKKSNEMKDRLFASISHDMRSPLNGIIFYINFAKNCENPQQRNEKLDIALLNSNMLLLLVNDFLDFASFQNNKVLNSTPKRFILYNMLEEVRSMIIMEAMNKNIKILIQIEGLSENISLLSDERRLKQVLINLFTNAIKFTFDGYIKLRVSSIPSDQNLLKFEMIDTGKGIRKEVIPLLMTPFATFDLPKQKVNGGGIGLGLFICKTLAGILGPTNNLFINSVEGKGTKVGFLAYIMKPKDESFVSIKSNLAFNNYFDMELDSYKEEDLMPSDFRDNIIKKKNICPNSTSQWTRPSSKQNTLNKMKTTIENTSNSSISLGNKRLISNFQHQDSNNSENKNFNSLILNALTNTKKRSKQFLTLASYDEDVRTNNLTNQSQSHFVLIVDDQGYNLMMLADMIKLYKDKNILIETANNGMVALEMFSERNSPSSNEPPYKIIFMDNEMPVMSGCEAGMLIKTKIFKEGFKDVKIICISGDNIETQMGIDKSYIKPITLENIFDCLKKYI